jgi:hypothetical protein
MNDIPLQLVHKPDAAADASMLHKHEPAAAAYPPGKDVLKPCMSRENAPLN